jgi:hypothetical protein
MEPLIHTFSKNRTMPKEFIEMEDKNNVYYDPIKQTSELQMGSYNTASLRSTNGTQVKNEADRVMDDHD